MSLRSCYEDGGKGLVPDRDLTAADIGFGALRGLGEARDGVGVLFSDLLFVGEVFLHGGGLDAGRDRVVAGGETYGAVKDYDHGTNDRAVAGHVVPYSGGMRFLDAGAHHGDGSQAPGSLNKSGESREKER